MSDDFNLQGFLPYLLNQAAESASQDFAEIYRERYGLHSTDWRVLFHLGALGEMSARDIVARSHETKVQVSRAVSRLEDREYLTRRRDPGDRRLELLKLTRKGLKVFDDLKAEAAAHDAALEDQIGARDMARLKAALWRLGTRRGT